MSVLQTHRLLVADEPSQQVGRVDPGGEEFNMGAAIRDPSHGDVGSDDLGGELSRIPALCRGVKLGGQIVLETLNPACWVAFFESYIRDITHVWPLHPETLKYLVLASGFTKVDIEYRTPVPPHDRLQTLPPGGSDLVEAFNANVEKLNARMFTYLDYAVIGAR